jgi:hypothetical protein
MTEKRTVHVVVIDNYFPELCELSIPTIEAWAKKIGARMNFITRRRWPDWPVLTEKLQVFYDGMDSDWNILLDADIMVHPDTPDMLKGFVPPTHVAAKDAYNADKKFTMDAYFLRDGRNIGLSTCAVISSRWCHDLWYPLPDEMTAEAACSNIFQERKITDEYCLSRNMARFGHKLTAPLDPNKEYDKFYHLGAFAQDPQRILEEAKRWRTLHWK